MKKKTGHKNGVKTIACRNCNKRFLPKRSGTGLRKRQVCPHCGEEMKPRKKIGKLEKEADYLFSRIVRFSRADRNGYVICSTCGIRKSWMEVDAGHFMSRRFRGTRYDITNVWPQCKRCNSGFGVLHWKPSESIKAAWVAWLSKNVAPGHADVLWKKAINGGSRRMSVSEAEQLIAELENDCHQLGVPF